MDVMMMYCILLKGLVPIVGFSNRCYYGNVAQHASEGRLPDERGGEEGKSYSTEWVPGY